MSTEIYLKGVTIFFFTQTPLLHFKKPTTKFERERNDSNNRILRDWETHLAINDR